MGIGNYSQQIRNDFNEVMNQKKSKENKRRENIEKRLEETTLIPSEYNFDEEEKENYWMYKIRIKNKRRLNIPISTSIISSEVNPLKIKTFLDYLIWSLLSNL